MSHFSEAPRRPIDDTAYLRQAQPLLLRRLSNAAEELLNSYSSSDFLYDAYPDYLSLTLLRDRLLREQASLTEEFLQDGCPIYWLSVLTDALLSELICRRRNR